MMLFGSAARNARGNDYFEKMVNEAINRTKEVKKTIGVENAIQLRKVNSVIERVIDYEGMDEYEAEKLGLIYNNLAPDDVSHKISAKMVKSFLEKTVKVHDPEAYEKIWRYYDFRNPLPEKPLKKLGIFVENIWNKYRTVEYCYQYSKSFHEFVDRNAVKVDADELDDLEKIKWLRLWLFIIKDQGFFWSDIKKNGTIVLQEQIKFDREVYLFPDCMLYLEEYISKYLPDKALNVEMLKHLIGLYPEKVQKQVYCWAELDGSDSGSNILRAGEVRMGIKRTLFPITWMTPMSLFCLNNNIKDNNPKFLEAAVTAYKNGGVENLNRIPQKGTDPFDAFKVKTFGSYEVYSSKKNNVEKVFVVNSQRELEMFVEVYKWLLEHPDFKFGTENKTLSEYGIDTLLEEEPEFDGRWFFEIGLVDSEEDINWELFEKVAQGKEDCINQYLKGEIDAEDLYEAIGFATDMQAKVCCNKRTKLVPQEATKMQAALKRIKMFGEAVVIKSDKIYLEIFKYMMSEKPGDLPKSMVNLYGSIFK